jgi:hypothetical protein
VPGSFTRGTNHFASGDQTVVPDHERRYAGLMDQVTQRLAALAPQDTDIAQVADAIVDTEHGMRPFRVHIDPADDGSEEVSDIADRIRIHFLTRLGLADLLTPHVGTS